MSFSELSNKISIVGIGFTPQGKVPGRTAAGFHCEAIRNAIEDAGLEKNDIDALLLYRHFDPIGGDYDMTAYTVAEQLGIRPAVLAQEYFCTRSWLYHSIGLLNSGLCKYVVLSYGDNARSAKRNWMKEVKFNKATDELGAYGDFSTLSKYAMLARRAMDVYGTGPDVWKEIAIAQRRWANINPIAGMHSKELTDELYEESPMMAEPFRLLDATGNSDGGRAIVLTTTQRAKSMGKPAVAIRGFGSANQPLSPYRLSAEDEESAAFLASREAFKVAGVTHKDIDICEMYDCFTYTVEATLRDYGFFSANEARDYLTRERLGPGGDFPVNTSGGMLSEAYFMGLTPLSEAYMQLAERCGDRQLGVYPNTKKPALAVVSDNAGVFQGNAALILERVK